MSDKLKKFWLIALALIGIKRFKIPDLHSSVLIGDLPEAGLYKLMRVNQVKVFVAYHELIKLFVEAMDLIGKGPPSEENQAATEKLMGGHPDFRNWITTEVPHLIHAKKQGRLYFALNQIDTMISKDLEKSIRRRSNEKNVVRRED